MINGILEIFVFNPKQVKLRILIEMSKTLNQSLETKEISKINQLSFYQNNLAGIIQPFHGKIKKRDY